MEQRPGGNECYRHSSCAIGYSRPNLLIDNERVLHVWIDPPSSAPCGALSGHGFKILLDLFASTPTPYRFKELPYVFAERIHGESKLDSLVVWEYLMLLLDKLIGRWVPVRFVLFAVVGGLGVIVHLTTLRVAMASFTFPFAQTIATVCAMTSNFLLNNMLTYRDQRLRGLKLAVGLLSFYAICSIGAFANVGVASAVFEQHYSWWVAGLAGSVVGVVWNYAVSSVFTWHRR